MLHSEMRSETGNVLFSWIFLGNVLHLSSPLPASLVGAPPPVILLEFCSSLDKGNPTIGDDSWMDPFSLLDLDSGPALFPWWDGSNPAWMYRDAPAK